MKGSPDVPQQQLAGDREARTTLRRSALLVLILMLVSAAALRLYLASITEYVPDEFEGYLPLAASIAVTGDSINLPWRGRAHPALVGYVVRLSQTLFGMSRLGSRLLHVAAGLGLILLVHAMARREFGERPALWAAAVIAFSEYTARTGSLATSHAVHLFLVSLAAYLFHRYLGTRRPGWLYAALASTAIAFYAKEHSVLMLAVFFVTLVLLDGRAAWRSVHHYLAFGLFAVLVLPDVAWNMMLAEPTDISYADHLQRIGGVGLSPYPLAFYLNDLVASLAPVVAGRPFRDELPEYESLNVVLGAACLAGVMVTAVGRHVRSVYLLTFFAVVFGFFTLIEPGVPAKELDPVTWAWVDASLLPAALLTGAVAGSRVQRRRWVLGLALCIGILWSVYTLLTAGPRLL